MKERVRKHINKYGTKKAAVLISSLIILAAAVCFTAAYLIAQTDPVVNTFVSGVDPYGSLTISNTVEHPYGDDYTIPDDIKFSFTVALGDDYADKTYGGYTTDEDGNITLSIPAGGSVTIDEIPVSVGSVTVTETDLPNRGFTVKGGKASVDIEIRQAEEAKAAYNNVYTPVPATNQLTVKGSKALDGRDWKDTDEFTFVLEQYDAAGNKWKSLGEKTVTSCDKTFDFSSEVQAVSFGKTGTYSFRVSEAEGTIGGITYDATVGNFNITVTDDDMDGSLEIKEVTSGSSNVTVTTSDDPPASVIQIDFTNKYAPEGSAQIKLNISKTMNDTSGQDRDASGFTFGLCDGDTAVETSEATPADGKATITHVFKPSEVGEYQWTLKEIAGGEAGIGYDDATYPLHISVVDNGDGTVSAYVYDSDDYKEGQESVPSGASDTYKASFTNKYDPDDADLKINGDIQLEGRSIKTGEFKFDLYETDSTYDTTDLDPVTTVSNTETDGKFSFGLTHSRLGTYYYAVKENSKKPLDGVSYDARAYHIKVVVTDTGGKLAANVTVLNEAGTESDIVFTNTYVPDSVSFTPGGTKTLTGKTLQADQFSFAMYKSDANFSAKELLGTVKNSADGSFSFSGITYSETGKYYYIIRELSDDPLKAVSYDATEYHVTVTVSDDKEGHLVVDEAITAVKDGIEKSASAVSFTNVYTAKNATIDISALKTLSGKKLEAGMFGFILAGTDSSFSNVTGTNRKATNDATGSVRFSDVEFSNAGTHYLVMYEDLSDPEEDITYDASKYGITVEVEDNGQGQLTASVKSIQKIGGSAVSSITFNNSCEKSSSSGSRGVKTGDRSVLLAWIAMMLISVEGLIVVMLIHRRKRG